MTDTLTHPAGLSPDGTGRPPSALNYREAAEATGLTARHLRRLVAAGRLEAVDHAGRRWVTTASILSAGLPLNAPKGGAGGADGAGDTTGRQDLVAEVTRLRERVAVLEAIAAERARHLDQITSLADRLVASLPAGDASPGRRRWRRRS